MSLALPVGFRTPEPCWTPDVLYAPPRSLSRGLDCFCPVIPHALVRTRWCLIYVRARFFFFTSFGLTLATRPIVRHGCADC